MNNLLFAAIVIALLYYFFYYLPNQKKNLSSGNTKPLTINKETQTDPQTIAYEPGPENTVNCPGPQQVQFPSAITIPDPEAIKKLESEKQALLKDQAQKEKTITGLNNSYNKLEEKTKTEIDNLRKKLTEKDDKIKELSEMEKSLDEMIKGIKELNQDLE